MASSNNPYVALRDAYMSQLSQQQAAEQAQMQRNYENEVAAANARYDQVANDAYIDYMLGLKALPETLSRQGLTGGASESANIALQSAYGRNRASNENDRTSYLAGLRSNYDSGLLSMNNNYLKQRANGLADYDMQIAEWEDAERLRAEQEAAAAAAAARYSSGGYGGSGGGSGSSGYDWEDYVDTAMPYDYPNPGMGILSRNAGVVASTYGGGTSSSLPQIKNAMDTALAARKTANGAVRGAVNKAAARRAMVR